MSGAANDTRPTADLRITGITAANDSPNDVSNDEPNDGPPETQAGRVAVNLRAVVQTRADNALRGNGVVDLRDLKLQGADLSGMALSGLRLVNADLSGANLCQADLSETDLTGAVLVACNLQGAHLERASLDKAELMQANLADADLSGAHARRAGFGHANLSCALLVDADMEGATFTRANLSGCDLRAAHLKGALAQEVDLTEADLSKADLSEADIRHATVAGARFVETNLERTRVRSLKRPESASFLFANIGLTDFCGAYLLRRQIMDENYLHEFRSRSALNNLLYWAWRITSDCGRSAFRWGAVVTAITLIYGAIYLTLPIDYGDHKTLVSPWYFSLVTLTTLGYGDVLPASTSAQLVVMSEVVMGYFMLGGLLSIFSNKMARRAD